VLSNHFYIGEVNPLCPLRRTFVDSASVSEKCPNPAINLNAKPVDAQCVFRAAEDLTCRLAGTLPPRERTW